MIKLVVDEVEPPRLCGWCGKPRTGRQRWCSKQCRQTAWRSRRLNAIGFINGQPLRLAYADPPYPGLAHKYYRNEPTYAGEVDHEALIARLVTFDGWALSTSAAALRQVLPMCPEGSRVVPWVKPIGVPEATLGAHNTWEPLIYMPARRLRPGFRDWLRAAPARGGGSLPGRKPLAFCAWLFRHLGAAPQDSFDDFYPGTGVVTKAFQQLGSPSSAAAGDEDEGSL